jgi:hypothetical protein
MLIFAFGGGGFAFNFKAALKKILAEIAEDRRGYSEEEEDHDIAEDPP